MKTIILPLCLLLAGCYGANCDDCEDADVDSDVDAAAWQDTDGDTIYDGDEGISSSRDTDGDTIPDFRDTDSDGDGLTDAVEAGDDDPATAPLDSDADDTPDYLDDDSDANGVDDADEIAGDMDEDGEDDFRDLDDDGDGCIDPREGSAYGLDTDDDAIPDFRSTDADGDGIDDEIEGCLDDCDGDLIPNRISEDSDGSGAPDSIEGEVNSDAASPTGADDVPDYCDDDNDGDGIFDSDEMDVYGTDPVKWDTDGDGFFDWLEIVAGTDPNDPGSVLPDEVILVGPSGDPVDVTFTTALPRVDIAILAGTGGGIADEIDDLAADLPSLLPGIPGDIEVSLVAFEDFGAQGYGAPGSVPVEVMLTSTGEEAEIAAGLASLAARGTSSAGTISTHASGVEAVYQAVTGEGLGGTIIPPADCSGSPLDPVRFGNACMREDAYSVIAILSDRMSRNAPGCAPGDLTCGYDEDDFPPLDGPHAYAVVGGLAMDRGVRVAGFVPDPGISLPGDPAEWLGDLATHTSTLDGTGSVVVVDVGTDASVTAEALADTILDLVTVSPFAADSAALDMPDSPPQPERSVEAYSLTALPVACDPPSGEWGECSFSSGRVTGVGPGAEVTVRLLFAMPSVHFGVDVLRFEVLFAVEERMVIGSMYGYLIIPEVWDPAI